MDAALVARAADGDQGAWDEVVERYAPLVWSICRRYLLAPQDIRDAARNVWLSLAEQLAGIHAAAGLPGWLAVTAQRECRRLLGINFWIGCDGGQPAAPPPAGAAMPGSWDDDEMLARLAHAQRAAGTAPGDFIEAGKAAYAGRGIGAAPAGSACDPALAAHVSTRIRAELAHLCALTFTCPRLTIEIEITSQAILGQVVPVQAGEAEVSTLAGPARTARIDDIGCFAIRPVPAGPFRLHCCTASGACVSTSWVTL